MLPRFLVIAALFAHLIPALRAGTIPDGLYATFNTTVGEFTVQLDFDKVPMTVANFVGLAEGSRPWVNFKTGQVSTKPFYDGLEIPRVVSGFVIQAGSPNNTTGGGPGYRFSDEFHPMLNHNTAGTLSMANSGSDTNGSQFFITLAATPNLNNKHSVFGSVYEGMGVVDLIGVMNGGDVTINSVTIVRLGTAAGAFDPTAWGLPVPRRTIKELLIDPAPYRLRFTHETFTEYRIFDSPDMENWNEYGSLTGLDTPSQTDVDVSATSAGQPDHYYSLPGVHYVPVPAALKNMTLDLVIVSTSQTLALGFTGDPRASIDYTTPLGSFSLDTVPPTGATTGGVGAYLWTQDLRRGQLVIALEGLSLLYFNFKFRGDGTGVFTGDTSPDGGSDGVFPFYGTFTVFDTP